MIEDVAVYLDRPLTRAEIKAIYVAAQVIAEALRNARACKYELESEAAELRRKEESLRMKIFAMQMEASLGGESLA